MHMADALISPVVGLTMIGTSGIGLAYSIKKIENNLAAKKVPLMAVMGAFVFVAQMINFTIPLTGSSGHLAGGLLLSILLGPYAAFMTLASILFVQALFFADGGLLALGCNLFNMGFFTCFISYPLIYKPIVGESTSKFRVVTATMLAAIVAIQLGSVGVVVQTIISGKADLDLTKFLTLMQSIHLGIGVVEGLVTTVIVLFLVREKPELVHQEKTSKKMVAILLIVLVFMGVFLVNFASNQPDGLEWSLEKTSENLEEDSVPKLAILPGYESRKEVDNISDATLSSIVGSGITVIIVGLIALYVTRRRKKNESH